MKCLDKFISYLDTSWEISLLKIFVFHVSIYSNYFDMNHVFSLNKFLMGIFYGLYLLSWIWNIWEYNIWYNYLRFFGFSYQFQCC